MHHVGLFHQLDERAHVAAHLDVIHQRGREEEKTRMISASPKRNLGYFPLKNLYEYLIGREFSKILPKFINLTDNNLLKYLYENNKKLPIFLGMSSKKEIVIEDLVEMPHLLVA